MTKEEVLKRCKVDGTIVRLPAEQLDRKLYLEVAKSLELIGGKWKGGKVAGFVFPSDPTELLEQIAGGEKRNLKKEFQFFATPPELADRLVALAQVENDHVILEPSAGQGAIVSAIHRMLPAKNVYYCELMPVNNTFMQRMQNVTFICEDFFALSQNAKPYDRIIANPPFAKNQDIDHILKMYEVLTPGGRLVSVASNHWRFSKNKKERAFRDWVYDMGLVEEIDAGVFSESGTNIAACIIIINKPQQ
jgi:protein-L-isoaspartate O-methyltransferase